MKKRTAKKIYQRTALKGAITRGPRLTDRERQAHKIWWKKSEAFRVDVSKYYGTVHWPEMRKWAKDVSKVFNTVQVKDYIKKSILDLKLFGNSKLEIDLGIDNE